MKTTERFNKAIKALVTAFFEETLAKGNCAACAVGNIVEEALEFKPCKRIVAFPNYYGHYNEGEQLEKVVDYPNSKWRHVFCTNNRLSQKMDLSKYSGLVKDCIDSTGYSVKELALVERSFENATSIFYHDYSHSSKKEIMEDQFNGLMAVVDVLCEIEGYDSNEYKKLFEYNEEFQPVNS